MNRLNSLSRGLVLIVAASVAVIVHASTTTNDEVEKLPRIESMRKDSHLSKGMEPSPLVKTVVGWEKRDRSVDEVRRALAALKHRESNNDLSEADKDCLLAFGISLNGQYHGRKFPEDVKEIKAEIHELIVVSLYLPKRIRDGMPPDLLSVAREMAEVSRTDFDVGFRKKYRAALKGKEEEALAYALSTIATSLDDSESFISPIESRQNEACLKFMLLLEDETLAYYQGRVASEDELRTREKVGLQEWGRFVEHPEAFRLMIDTLIDDKATPPQVEKWERVGRKLRFCDMAYIYAKQRIGDDHTWAEKALGLKVSERNEQISEFKVWWEANKEKIELSIGRRQAHLKKRPVRQFQDARAADQ